MFYIIKGDISGLSHVYQNGYGSDHYIKITNDISSFNFLYETSANGLSSATVTVASLGDNVVELQNKCFYGFSRLSGVSQSSGVKQIGDQCFENCTSLQFFDALMLGNIEAIGVSSFYNTGFKALQLSFKSGSLEIGEYAFAGCTELESVIFSDTTYFSPYMFSGCTKLEYCQATSQVRSIGSYAFSGCTGLVAFQVPNGMTQIPTGFFNGCTSLQICNFESYSSSGLQYVGERAFSGCANLQALTLPTSINSSDKLNGSAFAGSSFTTITFKGLPDSVFQGNSGSSSGNRYSTGQIYSNTSEGYNVIDEAINTNTPVIIIVCNTADKNNINKRSAAMQQIIYSSSSAISMKPYYFVHVDMGTNQSAYDYVLSHPTVASIMDKKRKATDKLGQVKISNDNYGGTVKTDSWPYILTIWNKSADQAGGQSEAGLYYTKICYTNKPSSVSNVFSLTVSRAADENVLESACTSFMNYIGGLFDSIYVAPASDSSASANTTSIGWGLDHDCILVSSSGTQYKFTTSGGGTVEESDGIDIDRTTTDGFKFGKWYGNVVELANYVECVNLSGYALDVAKPKDVPLEDRVGLIIVANSGEHTSDGSDDYSMFYNYVFSSDAFQKAMKQSACLLGYYDGDDWSGIKTKINTAAARGGALPFRLMSSKDPARPCVIYPKDGKFLYTTGTQFKDNYCSYVYYSAYDVTVDSNTCSKTSKTSTSGQLSPDLVLAKIPKAFGGGSGTAASGKNATYLTQSAHPKYM